MSSTIRTGPVHHLRLTVADVDRARDFYMRVLGFEQIASLPTGALLTNGSIILGVGPPPDGVRPGDSFDESRVGLDHLSLAVSDRAALDDAVRALNEAGVEHGGVVDLEDFAIHVLNFRDPDNIALELTAAFE
jgi:glyoxylase I family protein